MKFFKILLTGVLALFLLSGYVAMAEESILPTSGKIVGSIETLNMDRDLELRELDEDHIVVAVPIFFEPRALWQINASIGWTDGNLWEIISMDSYYRFSKIKNAWAITTIDLPKKGNGWYWVRIWGQNSETQEWLLINQSSKYHRVDDENKPGYEILVNTVTKQQQPVPKTYDTRE